MANIGYETIGSNTQTADESEFGFQVSGISGDITSITAALNLASGSGTYTCYFLIYNETDDIYTYSSVSTGDDDSFSLTTTYQWKTVTLATPITLSSSKTYQILCHPYYGGPFGPYAQIAYDTSTGTDGGYRTTGGWNAQNTRNYSIYATYTPSAPSQNSNFLMFF